jgi:hypothetical protein
MFRKIAVGLAAATAVLALVAAAKPPSGTGYEVVTRSVSYPAPSDTNNNGVAVSEVVACPAGKHAVNGGPQSIANGPGVPSDFPDNYSNYSRYYAAFTPTFGIGVNAPDLTFPPAVGPTADGWRVNGTVGFSGWGDSGTRGVDWDRYSAVVTFYAVCVNP